MNGLTETETASFVIDSLGSLLALVELLPPEDLVLGEDIMCTNNSVLVRHGQPLQPRHLHYLRTHENYVPRFVFQRSWKLANQCRKILIGSLQTLVASNRGPILTRALNSIGKEIGPLLNRALSDERLVLTLFVDCYLLQNREASLYDHLLLAGVLCAAVSRGMRSIDEEMGAKAIIAGTIHDIGFLHPEGAFASKDTEGSDAETDHAVFGAERARDWELGEDVAYAVQHHHSFASPPETLPAPPSDDASLLHASLSACECFISLLDVLQGDRKVEEAVYALGHYASGGRLSRAAVDSLAHILRAESVLTEVEQIAVIESQCIHGSAYAYPKMLHTKPTEILCKGRRRDCPLVLQSAPQLHIFSEITVSVLKDGFLGLRPGLYDKCSLQLEPCGVGIPPLAPEATPERADGKESPVDT